MAENVYFLAGEGSIWVQPQGPNTKPEYLGCHALGDLTEPLGDLNLIECPDPSAPNKFRRVGTYQSGAGVVTTSITTYLAPTRDWLESINCATPFYFHFSKRGRKDNFGNWDRSFVLVDGVVTQRTKTAPVARVSDDQTPVDQSFDISGLEVLDPVRPEVAKKTLSQTVNLNFVNFCDDEVCATPDAVYSAPCEVGIAGGAAVYLTTADVLLTADGTTWTAAAADPFAADEAVAAGDCFELDRNTTRRIVARGTADAGNPMEIAYSDDGGATWTLVNVGAINGQYATGGHSLLVIDVYNIYLVTTGGYVYYSEDGGATWTAQDAGVATAQNLNSVDFASDKVTGYAAGAANAIIKTVDGGAVWAPVAGPAAKAAVAINVVKVVSPARVWLGYADGDLFYSHDGGTTWAERNYAGSGIGQVRSIDFRNPYVGLLLHNNASPVATVYLTINGGYTWEAITTGTNVGGNYIKFCTDDTAWAAMNAIGGLSTLLKITL